MSSTAIIESPAVGEGVVCHDQLSLDVGAETCAAGAAAVFSLRCPDKPKPSEDCAAIIDFGSDASVLAVADGLGGLPAGDQASRVAIERLRDALSEAFAAGLPLRTGILNGFEDANRAVLELGLGAATTMAVVEIQQAAVRPYHVGDSTVLIVGQRGKIKLQTVSHSPVGYAIEAGLLDQAEAMHHEHRHLISNMIGSADMHITIGPTIELASRDTVLVASDGLTDNLHLAEIIDRIRKGSIEQAAAALAQDSLARMTNPAPEEPSKPDDLTAIVFRRVL